METDGKGTESRLLFLAISADSLLPQAQCGGGQAGDRQGGGGQGIGMEWMRMSLLIEVSLVNTKIWCR